MVFIGPAVERHKGGTAVADEAVRDFAASTASEYRLSTRKTTLLDRKY
jgi:hypothetical protein